LKKSSRADRQENCSMKLDFSNRVMDIGTFQFNFVRALMVAGTGGAELSECLLVAQKIRDGDAESWTQQWAEVAEKVHQNAIIAADTRRTVTARHAYLRTSNYYRAAMFSLPHTDTRLDRYLTLSRETFHAAAKLSVPPIEIVDVPFGKARLPAYFMPAESSPAPTLIVVNGGDSTNEEMVHWFGFAAAARGWNCITFEGPGQWSAMQLNPGLHLQPDYEGPVTAVVEYLLTRTDVDPDKIAMYGLSLGASLAARAAAFEHRISACICDGLVVDVYQAWQAVWPHLLQSAPSALFDGVFGLLERVSPQLRGIANHFRWMLDAKSPHEIIEAWKPYGIKGLAPKIGCPMLVIYGEAEAAQSNEVVALEALRFVSELRSPTSVRMFGLDEGWAATHCQVGALAPLQALVFDWLQGVVVEKEPQAGRIFDEKTVEILPRYLRSAAAKAEAAALLAATGEHRIPAA
jgi:pimeloyl-ACP methyl ester carboxylesterase